MTSTEETQPYNTGKRHRSITSAQHSIKSTVTLPIQKPALFKSARAPKSPWTVEDELQYLIIFVEAASHDYDKVQIVFPHKNRKQCQNKWFSMRERVKTQGPGYDWFTVATFAVNHFIESKFRNLATKERVQQRLLVFLKSNSCYVGYTMFNDGTRICETYHKILELYDVFDTNSLPYFGTRENVRNTYEPMIAGRHLPILDAPQMFKRGDKALFSLPVRDYSFGGYGTALSSPEFYQRSQTESSFGYAKPENIMRLNLPSGLINPAPERSGTLSSRPPVTKLNFSDHGGSNVDSPRLLNYRSSSSIHLSKNIPAISMKGSLISDYNPSMNSSFSTSSDDDSLHSLGCVNDSSETNPVFFQEFVAGPLLNNMHTTNRNGSSGCVPDLPFLSLLQSASGNPVEEATLSNSVLSSIVALSGDNSICENYHSNKSSQSCLMKKFLTDSCKDELSPRKSLDPNSGNSFVDRASFELPEKHTPSIFQEPIHPRMPPPQPVEFPQVHHAHLTSKDIETLRAHNLLTDNAGISHSMCKNSSASGRGTLLKTTHETCPNVSTEASYPCPIDNQIDFRNFIKLGLPRDLSKNASAHCKMMAPSFAVESSASILDHTHQ